MVQFQNPDHTEKITAGSKFATRTAVLHSSPVHPLLLKPRTHFRDGRADDEGTKKSDLGFPATRLDLAASPRMPSTPSALWATSETTGLPPSLGASSVVTSNISSCRQDDSASGTCAWREKQEPVLEAVSYRPRKRNKLRKKRRKREPPIQDRISMFESLSQPTNDLTSEIRTRESNVLHRSDGSSRNDVGGSGKGYFSRRRRQRQGSHIWRMVSSAFENKERRASYEREIAGLDPNRNESTDDKDGGLSRRPLLSSNESASNLSSSRLCATSATTSSAAGEMFHQLSRLKLELHATREERLQRTTDLDMRKTQAGLCKRIDSDMCPNSATSSSRTLHRPPPDPHLLFERFSARATDAAESPLDSEPTVPKARSRYPSSWGKSVGESFKKSCASPVLTISKSWGHEGAGESRGNVSWGRKAAAAAFGIGQRLKERERAGESSSSNALPGKIAHREGPAGGGDIPIIATTQCGLQHPRPSRVVNLDKFVTILSRKEGRP